MYLEKIEIHGFKSFGDAVILTIPKGITGIIGPNGSGKSNVSDAIRWALGEQSAKVLRGSKMEDVIFSGTDKRKSLGYAEVTITIQNDDKKLPIDYAEVSVKRRVYRSGESEYFINGSPCRLKDIQELFMDTGIGKEGYSIIGQGQIDKVLTSKPEERRALFEEAAGIYKYKVKKQEAERKLEKEHENLVRVQDIIEEIERRLKPLKIEAEKTTKFLKLRDELKVVDINIFLSEMTQLEKEIETLSKKLSNVESELRDQETLKIRYVHSQGELKIKRERFYQEVEDLLQKVAALEKEKTIKQSQMTLNKEKISSALKLIKQVKQEQKDYIDQYDSKGTKLNALELRLNVLTQEQIMQEDLVKQEETHVKNLEEQLSDTSKQKKQLETELHLNLREKDTLEATSQKNKEVIQTLNLRMTQIKDLSQTIEEELKKQSISKAQLEEKQATKEEHLVQLNQSIQTLKRQKETLNDNKKQLESENSVIYQKKLQLERQIEWLKHLKEENEGYFNSVKQVLKLTKADKIKWQGIIGVVGDLLEVPKQYEIAIVTALGGAMQYIVTNSEKDARNMIEMMKQKGIARVTFLPLDTIQPQIWTPEKALLEEKGVIGLANKLVTYNVKYQSIIQSLLGKIIIVEDMNNASIIAKKYRYRYRLVTLQGEIFNPGGALSGGSTKNQATNLFSRSRELREAQEAIKKLVTKDSEIEKLLQNLEEVTKHCQELEQTYKEEEIKTQQNHLEQEKISQLFKLNQNSQNQLAKEYQEIEKTKSSQMQLNKKSYDKLKLLEKVLSEQTLRVEKLENKQELLQVDYNERSKSLMNKQIQLTTIIQDKKHIEQQLGEAKETINDYETKQATFNKAITDYKKEIEALEEKVLQIQNAITQDDKRILKKQEERLAYEGKKNQIEQDEKNIEVKLSKVNEKIQLLQEESYRLKTKKETKEQAKQNWQTKIWEQYELSYHHALKYQEDSLSIATLKERALKLRSSIKTIGNVNINAVEDYKETNERYAFLIQQKTDIEKATEMLKKMIDQLIGEMKEIFRVQFSIIAHSFSEVFKELFGGGEAYLELVDEEHILDSGIEIIAKPPGKKLQNMSLLSGGERTLTAISLIFGILKLKPSPFCVLDEIEAALDEANVIRFANYLDKLSKQTQFIVITHRKGTMEYAHTLYGVTQQDKGVSTILSIQLDEAYHYAKQENKE